MFPLFFDELKLNYLHFGFYQVVCWAIISYFSAFYEIYRYTTPVQIISKLIRQGILFMLVVIAFFPFAKQTIFSGQQIAKFLLAAFAAITLFKFILFYYLKRYRSISGNNIRNTIIIGYTEEAIRLKELFDKRTDYGYRFFGFFSDKAKNSQVIGRVSEIKSFAIENSIDDIYCSLNEISNAELRDLVNFADFNNKIIKFIPDTKDIFSKNLKIDYYEFFPVLSLRKTPLHEPVATFSKRVFDILFSFVVIVLVLSWLTPILALLIKAETRGPVFFKQKRNGLNYHEFSCYKFRSMRLNEVADLHQVSKNDPRITKIGRFIRKTSIDELPQFLNVLLGDMSVVGPRPHMVSHTEMYAEKVERFMVRHLVKPGITGLAQTKGFRGEVENDSDIIYRVKYDIFYLENWSLLLDIKIIIQTVYNAVKGEDKAY
ncbi:MAG: undecaprenyl-phosphate glucose phosphotransferase [Flavobacterium sp.]|nr:MAG: undecaprenyl-phosphate glucose phosphotransferase [Flavobacterium sp.]